MNLDFSSLARWNEPTSIQPKQSCFRISHHHWAVNWVELLPSIFIRLQNPYLQTSLSSASLYQSTSSQLEQPVVIWQNQVCLSTWKLPWGMILDSSVVLILPGTCLSGPSDIVRHLCGKTGLQCACSESESVVPLPFWLPTVKLRLTASMSRESVKLLWNISSESDQKVN